MRDTECYFPIVADEIPSGFYSKIENLRFHTEFLFGDVDFSGKTVIDIGGGWGLFSFYAALNGASRVVCLEPEFSGSRDDMNSTFTRIQQKLQADNVVLDRRTIQELQSSDYQGFDIVLSHNSINHFNEDACQRLGFDESARLTYLEILRKIAGLTSLHGRMIIVDCSNKNLFASLGLNNPFAKSIEWSKHQSPDVWAALLAEVGFSTRSIRWNSFGLLGSVGKALLGNRLGAYCTFSHFRLDAFRD